MQIYARQGDLVIERTERTELSGTSVKKVMDLTLAGASSGHPHRIEGEVLVFPAAEGEHQIRIKKKTTITHSKPDGHKIVVLEPGDYRIRPLRERGGNGDRNVED